MSDYARVIERAFIRLNAKQQELNDALDDLAMYRALLDQDAVEGAGYETLLEKRVQELSMDLGWLTMLAQIPTEEKDEKLN